MMTPTDHADITISTAPSHMLKTVHLMLLVVATSLLYLIDANNDFLGGNDFLKGNHSAIFAGFLDWTAEDVSSPAAVLSKILLMGHAFSFYPHGPLPPVYFGFFYKLLDIIGVPFSAFTIQLPTALLSVAGIILFYLVLLKARINPWIAFITALILSLSPIYVLSARGISTYWTIAIVFNQALAIYALQNLRDTRASKILVSLTFVHILLSDVLSFLLFAALLAGYGLRNYTWRFNRTFALDILDHFRHNLAPLASPIIFIPALTTLLFLGAVSVVGVVMKNIGGGIPLYPVLLFWALFAHGGELFSGDSLGLSIWLTRIVHTLGEAAPLLIATALCIFVVRRKSSSQGFLWHFAWISSLGFGLLFYVIANDHPSTLYLDQIYTLIPFLTFAAVQLSYLAERHVWGKALTIGILTLTSIGALISSVTLVWSVPISTMSDRLIINETSLVWSDALGFKIPNDGHRAAGYIARTLLKKAWSQDPDRPIQVIHSSTLHPRAFEPFLIYAGLIQKGDWFANTLGIKPDITYLHTLPNTPTSGQNECGDAPACDLWTSSKSYENEYHPLDDAERDVCSAPFCVSLTFGSTSDKFKRYELMSENKIVQVLSVRGLPTTELTALPPGRYQITSLDRRFESEFTRLWDYFPKRAAYRTHAIVQRLLGVE